MFVKTVTVGGKIMVKMPDIKSRGRCGTIRKPLSSMRIVMEERGAADFYRMMLKGETPHGMSALFRRIYYQNKADFEHVKASSYMLSAKGRRYRRVQFQRLVQSI